MDGQPAPLPSGARAPDFSLPRSRSASVSLSDFRGRRVILAFYPADWEPVSREQLALYQEYLPALEGLRANLVGISPDGIWSHTAFARDAGIRFPLLADSRPKGAVARSYGVYLEHEELSCRALFVIDERGFIHWRQTYPILLNPGIQGVMRALGDMGLSRARRPGERAEEQANSAERKQRW
jgi:peroxiredoxin